MSAEHLLHDIRELNLSYLLLVQRLVNTDRELAKFRLKINDEMAELLSTIPLADLMKLAHCNQLLCHFSLDDPAQLYSLINTPQDDDMRRIHAAILLSGPTNRKTDRRRGDRRVTDSADYTGPERRQGERRRGDRRQKGAGRAGAASATAADTARSEDSNV